MDKQFKRFERHLKRNATQLSVQRSFVLLVDVCTQTEAMIDHATQTGLPILIDTVTPTGDYSVVYVISRSTPRKLYVMQDKEVIWVTRTTQTETAYMLHKGVDVPDIESVQPTIFSSLDVRDDHIRYYTGLPSSAVFTKLFTMLNDVFLAKNDGFCSSLAPKKQFLMVLMKLRHAFKHQDLAYRFQVAVTQVSRIFHYCRINIMSRELPCLIHWPDRWQSIQQELLCFCQNVGVDGYLISTLQLNVVFCESFFQVTWFLLIGDLILLMTLHCVVHPFQFPPLERERSIVSGRS